MINRILDVVDTTMWNRYHADRDGGEYLTTVTNEHMRDSSLGVATMFLAQRRRDVAALPSAHYKFPRLTQR